MPKERTPISSRLRRREKDSRSQENSEEIMTREESVSATSDVIDNNLSFSPRIDPDIYLDELHSDLSYIRGTKEDKSDYLRQEQDRLQKSFGRNYNPRVKISTFYQAQVSAPVPSKRTHHRIKSTKPYSEPQRVIIKKKPKDPIIPNIKEVECTIPLPLSKRLPVYIKMDPKEKEKEYWRRQRRVFVHSRFITNEEGVMLAKTVYSNLTIHPTSRFVTSLQGNIANFRTKLRRIFDAHAKSFHITRALFSNDQQSLENGILSLMTTDILKSIWDHWIANPFVDTKLFYQDNNSVEQLKVITTKLIIIHFREQFSLLSPKQARLAMKEIDLISRKLELPDTTDLA